MRKASDTKTKREIKAHREMHSINMYQSNATEETRQMLEEAKLAKTPRSKKHKKAASPNVATPERKKRRWIRRLFKRVIVCTYLV